MLCVPRNGVGQAVRKVLNPGHQHQFEPKLHDYTKPSNL